MALEDWLPTLTARLAELPGLDGGAVDYRDLPGSILEFPKLVILPLTGRETWGASLGSVAVHQLQATLYLAPQFLPEAFSVGIPFIARLRNQLAANLKLGGLVDSVGPSAGGDFYDGPGVVRYGDKEYLGIIFRIQVKDHDTLTVSAG